MNAKRKNHSGTRVLNCGINHHPSGAFTLTELLVVLATLAILAVLVLPGLAGPQPRSQAFQCLNNMRQLMLAWTMYAGDNNERLAINSDPHSESTPYYPQGTSNPSWVTGTLDWTSGSYNTNTAFLINNKYSLFGNYIATSTNVFECPAANYVSPPERALGWYQRARSVAMDAAGGDGFKYTGFGWSQWYVVKKTTDFNTPGPSQSWVFIDEHPDSIDDALFYTSSYPTTSFTEMPANYHDGAAAITFADGHVAMQKWTGSILPFRPV
jgi:prepilin-type processing-associated H-X9-DG protein